MIGIVVAGLVLVLEININSMRGFINEIISILRSVLLISIGIGGGLLGSSSILIARVILLLRV